MNCWHLLWFLQLWHGTIYSFASQKQPYGYQMYFWDLSLQNHLYMQIICKIAIEGDVFSTLVLLYGFIFDLHVAASIILIIINRIKVFIILWIHCTKLSFTFPGNFWGIPAFPAYFRDFGLETWKTRKRTEMFNGFCLGIYIYRNLYKPNLGNFLWFLVRFPSDSCSCSLDR